MQYLIATYWTWFVVALLAGGAVAYWLPWRRAPEGGTSHLLFWGAAAFLAGLAVAVLNWFPQRTVPYLEICLLLSFWFALGGLPGSWLRAATSRREAVSATLVANAQIESAVLGARAKAAVRSDQDSAASTKAVEEARLAVEAKAAEVVRVAAAAKAAEDAGLAAEAKATEEARVAAAAKAAEEARLAAETKAAGEARLTAAVKAVQEERVAAEAKAAEAARVAAAAKPAEDARLAAEKKAAEEARLAAAVKAVQDERVAVEAKAAEVVRIATAAKPVEDARPAAEKKTAEEARLAAAVKAVQDERVAIEAKASEEARIAVAAKPAEDRTAEHKPAESKAVEGVATTTAQPELHRGSKPQGIAAPAEGEADDLKLIRGMGPRNEKACHALGIYQFRQIADWMPDEAIWVGHHIAFPGRIEREHWIAQARLLASGGETEHSRAVKSGSMIVDDKADEPLDPAAAERLGMSLPEQAAAVDEEGKHPGRRPYGLAMALGQADNLKRIRGIGPQNAGRLHGLGIWHFSQIAAWTDENVKWVGSYLASSGRIHREKWVAQARDLVVGKETESSRRGAAGNAATSKDNGSLGQGDVQSLK